MPGQIEMLEVVANRDRRAHQRVEFQLVRPRPAASGDHERDLALPMGLSRLAVADGKARAIAGAERGLRQRDVGAAAVELDANIAHAIHRLQGERWLLSDGDVVLQLETDRIAEQEE